MKKHFFIAITALTISSALFIVSCLKKASTPTPQTTTYSLDQLFAELRSTPQQLKVWAGRDTIVFGADSTMLHFYTNSFRDASNNVITGQWIYLNLTEYYTGGDMISNGITTVAGSDSLLQSGGEINLTATNSESQTVYINPFGIGFKQRATSNVPMQLYNGYTNASDSAVHWHQDPSVDSAAHSYHTTYDTTHYRLPVNFYVFDTCTHSSYINCDFFPYYPPDSLTKVVCSLPDSSFNGYTAQVFLYFPSIKSSMILTWYKDSFSTWSVPIGMPYDVVALASKGGNFYYYQSSGTTNLNMTINATMTVTTIANIKTELSGL